MAAQQPGFSSSATKMPVLFVGHGSPMNAIEDNEFSRTWRDLGQTLPRPEAILCVSAHWETAGTQVTAMEKPKTIHDFGGFPPELFVYQYPAPGSAALARLVQETITSVPVTADLAWGLDHGTWSVLCRLFPKADVPVVQLSLDYTKAPADHYAIGRALAPLRTRGVMVIGSGNVVHNLRLMRFSGPTFDWAIEFDEAMKKMIVANDHDGVIHYERLGRTADLAVPTNEHFLPLLYALALQDEGETPQFFNDKMSYASLSMRSLRFG